MYNKNMEDEYGYILKPWDRCMLSHANIKPTGKNLAWLDDTNRAYKKCSYYYYNFLISIKTPTFEDSLSITIIDNENNRENQIEMTQYDVKFNIEQAKKVCLFFIKEYSMYNIGWRNFRGGFLFNNKIKDAMTKKLNQIKLERNDFKKEDKACHH